MVGIEWSSLISAGIGGATALAGVLITQRSERKKAHADRVWTERSTCYVQLYSWCGEWIKYLMAAPGFGRHMMKDPDAKLPKEPPDLAEDAWARIFVYSSSDVVKALTASQQAAHFARASLIGRDEDYVQKSLDGLNAMLHLHRIIAVETRTGGRAGVSREPFVTRGD
jgi:hypothetical protein